MTRPSPFRAALAALLVAMSVSGTARSDPLDQATAAYAQGDYLTALDILRSLAAAGNRSAQYNLGMMYVQGKGVAPDYAQAAAWYRKAALQGDVDAQRALASMYQYGKGVPHSNAEAATWYRKAADQGDGTAQFNLGVMYNQGDGVAPNVVEAYRWFTLASTSLPASDPNHDNAVTNRNMLVWGMTPEQIATAQKLAREWKPAQ